jgi:putative acetyltransferase
MFEEYSKLKSVYFVVEKEGEILGCAGIAPLENEETITNFKNVFTRGLDWEPNDGNLFAKCKRWLQCYLETMPFMLDKKLYKK